MNFITSLKSGRLKLDQPDWLLRLCGDMLLELDQEILEGWESPRDNLVLIQAVWGEKQPGNKATAKPHNQKWYQNKAKVKTSAVN